MPRPEGGAAIVYGKIQVHGGAGTSVNEVRKVLDEVMKKWGYPEQEDTAISEEDIEQEMAEQDAEALSKEDREEEEADGEEAKPLPPWVRRSSDGRSD